MNVTDVRKVFLKLFIGFLVLSAGIAVFCVLSGDFGEFELRVLGSTFTISAASICSMSCAAFIEKRKHWWPGMSGIVLACGAALMLVIGIWAEVDDYEYWKCSFSMAILAAGAAHAFLLLLPRLSKGVVWTQYVALVVIGMLAVSLVGALLWEIDDEGFFRWVAVLSIVVVLFTLSIPILMKMSKEPKRGSARIVLEENADGSYSDTEGRRYQLVEIEEDE